MPIQGMGHNDPMPSRAPEVFHHVASSHAAGITPVAGEAVAGFAHLERHLAYLGAEEIEKIRQAFRFADAAHLGQFRRNAAPYITHPLAVAAIVAGWQLDTPAIVAALLHDVMEDCGVDKSTLLEHFGSQVAQLVDGLTKLDKLQFTTREENQAESFRKMLLAMAKDVRVILIKLADRTHNMRTLGDVPRSKWARIAQETLDIYVPIAHRLGLHQTYRELQDLAFCHLYPWRHAILNKALEQARRRRKDLLGTVQDHVRAAFAKAGMSLDISGREKTLYSIYRKMRQKQMSFGQVSDIYGFRVIVPAVTDCYTALGILHQMYPPVPGRFKDYIAIPKVNAYQSLHTTLVGPAGLHIEFQFRTETMNAVAEAGVAAHWQYKTVSHGDPAPNGATQWLQSLLDIQNETRDAAEFWDHIKVDLFPDEVYVLTPKGKIMAMPRGATVVDFAYAIHTDVGNRAVGARINGDTAPLRAELRNGDMVEISVSPAALPNPAWLSFVTTGRARSKIRHHLKTYEQGESQKLGEKLLRQALRVEGLEKLPDVQAQKLLWEKLMHFTGNKTVDELMVDLGLGKRVASIVAKRMVALYAESSGAQGLLSTLPVHADTIALSKVHFDSHDPTHAHMELDGSEPRSTVQYAACCSPVPGDGIVGYMGHGEGLIVHRSACPNACRLLSKDRERFIAVEWSEEPTRPFDALLRVTLAARKGGIARVATAIARSEADIVQMHMGQEQQFGDASEMDIAVSVRDLAHFQQVLRNLERESVVMHVSRAAEG